MNRCGFINQCLNLLTGAELRLRLAKNTDGALGRGLHSDPGLCKLVPAIWFVSFTQVGAGTKGQCRKEEHTLLCSLPSSNVPSLSCSQL
jgi:hypothetical protein